MSFVVVKGAGIKCGHGGPFGLAKGDTRPTVGGIGVVTLGVEAGLTFGFVSPPAAGVLTPCTAQTTSSVYVPCMTSPAAIRLGLKLALRGMPAVLARAKRTPVSGVGLGTWSVADSGQQKLEST